MSTALLQTTYFGPIQWYQKLYPGTDGTRRT